MIVLDCESLESAKSSIERILSISIDNMMCDFCTVDFELLYENYIYKFNEEDDYSDFGMFLANYMITKYALNVKKIDRVYWFHLSRTLNRDSYKNGIKPLGLIRDDLFQWVFELIEDRISITEWSEILSQGNWLYKMKIDNAFYHGPYAMLVKEIAFHSQEVGNYNYLEIPEIVRDISNVLEETYGFSLSNLYQKKSVSLITKFYTSPEYNTMYYLSVVLHYIYCRARNEELSIQCNTCFDAKNKIISASKIVEIVSV